MLFVKEMYEIHNDEVLNMIKSEKRFEVDHDYINNKVDEYVDELLEGSGCVEIFFGDKFSKKICNELKNLFNGMNPAWMGYKSPV